MSTGNILSIARSAILAHQAAIAVAGHNIANAETAGYTRQELLLQPGTPESTPQGIFGTGVSMVTVTGHRDALLSQDVRTQSAPSAAAQERSDLLGQIEAVFGEPTDGGLANVMDAFWNSWSDLASNPSSVSAKTVVQQRGADLAATLNRFATQVAQIDTSVRSRITASVTELNGLTRQIADVNASIVPAESDGSTANDLRDQRDRLIDQLSGILPVTVVDLPNGANQVLLGGIPIVDGIVAKAFTQGSGVPLTISIAGSSDALRNVGGRMGALLDVVNNRIPYVTSQLDAMASSLIGEVNALHTAGWSPAAAGVDFFDSTPANGTARNIRLSAAVSADASAIAAGNVPNATGNNTVALGIASLRDFAATAPGNSYGDAYRTLVSTVAVGKQAADNDVSVTGSLADLARARRSAATGVTTDEELIRMMRSQQAYSAAAKVIQVADEMAQTLLDLKR